MPKKEDKETVEEVEVTEEEVTVDPLDAALEEVLEKEEAPEVEEIEEEKEETEEEEDDSEEETEEEETEASAEEEEVEEEEEEASEDDGPMDHWSDEIKTKFKEIKDPAAKALVKELSAGFQSGVQQRQEEVQADVDYANQIKSLFTDQDRVQFQAQGQTEPQVIGKLVGLLKWSKQDPKGYITTAMKDLGVSLEDLAPEQSPLEQTINGLTDAQVADMDPGVVAILQAQNRQIQQLSQNLNNQYSQFEINSQRQAWESQMSSFAALKDDKGQLKWPHFEVLKPRIQNLMSADSTIPLNHEGLERAYKSVILSDPVLGPQAQALLVQPQQQKVDKKKSDKKALKKAKKAAPPVKSKRSEEPQPPKFKGSDALDQATSYALDQHLT